MLDRGPTIQTSPYPDIGETRDAVEATQALAFDVVAGIDCMPPSQRTPDEIRMADEIQKLAATLAIEANTALVLRPREI